MRRYGQLLVSVVLLGAILLRASAGDSWNTRASELNLSVVSRAVDRPHPQYEPYGPAVARAGSAEQQLFQLLSAHAARPSTRSTCLLPSAGPFLQHLQRSQHLHNGCNPLPRATMSPTLLEQ